MYFPEELLVEILSRVPAASLVPFRMTCKRWNALINDGRFKKKHSGNAPRPSLVIMLIGFRVYLACFDLSNGNNVVKVTSKLTLNDPLSNNSSEEVGIRGLFHCDGLLLCITKDNRLVVWNPCSGETRWIQPRNSYKEIDFYALGKSSCNKYKILRIDQHGHLYGCIVEYEVYDFTTNSWRGIGKTTDWFIPRTKSQGIYVEGNAYWLASGQVHDDILLSFDFSTERFGRISLPRRGDCFSYDVFALSVTREEQQLCTLATPSPIMNSNVYDIDVWLANKIESNTIAKKKKQIESSTGSMTSWSKLLTVKQDYEHQLFCFANGLNFLADRENKVIVCRGKHGVSKSFLHIVGEDKYIQVDHHDAGSICSFLLSYVPTLVQIHQ